MYLGVVHFRALPVAVYAQIGGIFALLVLVHFVADWVFQSHAEAMAKPTNHWIRAKHCLIYTALMLLSIVLTVQPSIGACACMAGILFLSHFFEDTYLPVFVWAKMIRKPPEMVPPPPTTHTMRVEGLGDIKFAAPEPGIKEFLAFAGTPLGKILLIAIDQIVHLVFLLPVAAMIVLPEYTARIAFHGALLTFLLMNVTLIGSRHARMR